MVAEIAHVRPAQFDAWSSSLPTPAIVLDVREPWELRIASIAPTKNAVVAIPMMQLPERIAELQHQAPIAVLCHHGVRSLQVAQFLVHQGYNCVANITGGIAAWSQEVDATMPQY